MIYSFIIHSMLLFKFCIIIQVMSIMPVMQSSGGEFQNRDEASFIKKGGGLSRQGSFGSSEDDQFSGQNEMKGSNLQSKHEGTHRHKNSNSLASKIVGNIYFQIFITLLTVITLVLYDIKTIACEKQQDFAVGIVNCIFFAVFMVEIGMNTKTQGYFCSFFFYLDLVSTITILFDVDFITDAMFNQSSGFQVSNFVAKSKASRVAARAVRVVKIFRLTRVAKLYKSAQRAKELNQKDKLSILEKQNNRFKTKSNNQNDNNGFNNDDASNHNLVSRSFITKKNVNTSSNIERYELQNDSIKQQPNPSKEKTDFLGNQRYKTVIDKSDIKSDINSGNDASDFQNKQSQISKILTEDTIKKIVIIILLIMIEIPLLNINNYENISTQWDYTTTFIANSLLNSKMSINSIHKLIEKQIESVQSTGIQAAFICIDSPFAEISTCAGVDFSQYRTADLGAFSQSLNSSAVSQIRPYLTFQTITNSQNSGDSIIIFIDYSRYNSIDAGFSIATTLFICLTIIYLLSEFSGNINDLVIIPIQRMLSLVRAKDYRQQQNKQENEQKGEEYETKLVQKAIIRIKALMQTIYGPLGNDLVQQKMLNNKSISVNLMQSIKKSFCVTSICKLNHISKITQLLGEDAFGFINEIALIVHNAAFRYGGYCTKVLDSGFLIIFKMPEAQIQKYNIEEDIHPIGLSKCQQKTQQAYINNFCDFAVYFALKTLARIVKEPKLFKYRNDQRLLIGFGGVFSIQMNFAFSMGWLNEAVIGSSHKIDPLFLGEEINHLERVILISQNYPSSILITESLYTNLSSGLKYHIRPFDIIKFDLNQAQKTLYFVDYDMANVAPSVNITEKIHKEVKDLKTKKSMNMLYLSGLLKGDKAYNATTFISSKKQLFQILRKIANDEVRRKRYEIAFEKYIKGQWAESQQFLQSENFKSDIPTQRLYNLLQLHNFKVPSNWKGYRLYSQLFDKN